jgi:dynein light intermediate chain
MDELIRQVTISCAERGLLLLRVRDELRMTVSSYESLYESSIAYGIRKALMAAQQRRDLESRLGDLENNKKELRAQIDGLRKSIGESKTRLTEKKEADKKAHGEEVERIKKTNEQLRLSLESLLAAPPKK